MAVQIAGARRAHALDALAAQAEHPPGLRLRRNLHGRLAVEGGDVDLAAQRGDGEADRHLAMQVVAVALEDRVLAQVDDDVEVAGRTAVDARFTLAGEPNAVALVDTRRNLDRQRLLNLDAALAVALAARRPD